VGAPAETVSRVFQACNNYFRRCPYCRWFDKLERVLKYVDDGAGDGALYYKGSACHFDLVQWATDPVWRHLAVSDRNQLIKADAAFLRRQLFQEKFQVLLLNGMGVVVEYKKWLGGVLTESPFRTSRRLMKLFKGRAPNGLKVIGWNINVQATPGVSNQEIDEIGAAVKDAVREMRR
jgi:hypothetical protein